MTIFLFEMFGLYTLIISNRLNIKRTNFCAGYMTISQWDDVPHTPGGPTCRLKRLGSPPLTSLSLLRVFDPSSLVPF